MGLGRLSRGAAQRTLAGVLIAAGLAFGAPSALSIRPVIAASTTVPDMDGTVYAPDLTTEEAFGDSGELVNHLQIASGDTLAKLLEDAGATANDIESVLVALRPLYDPRRLTLGSILTITLRRDALGEQPRLSGVSFPTGNGYATALRDDEGRFSAFAVPRPAQSRPLPAGEPAPTTAAEAPPLPEPAPAHAALAAIADEPAVDSDTRWLKVDRIASLLGLLLGLGAPRADAEAAVKALAGARDVDRLPPGEVVAVTFADQAAGAPRRLGSVSIAGDGRRFLTAVRDAKAGFLSQWLPGPAAMRPYDEVAVPRPRPQTYEYGALSVPTWDDAGEDAGAAPRYEVAPDRRTPGEVAMVMTVVRGDTLMDVVLAAGAKESEAAEAIGALKGVYNPRGLAPGHAVKVTLTPNDDDGSVQLNGLDVITASSRDVSVVRERDAFSASLIDKPTSVSLVRAAGEIDSSLYEAGDAAGVPAAVIMQVIQAFSWDIDFQRDVQPGDSFEVVFERAQSADGRWRKTGKLRAARLTVAGKERWLYRHATRDGEEAFFDAQGKSARKAFLRTPVDGARLSSRFGMRNHPILGYTRMHRGVDFAAPTGTPIYAAATGVVEFVGHQRGYGRVVRLQHKGDNETLYGHMSAFARGLRKGQAVKQGQVIGYVGMTGTATGPHLHYEVAVKGQQVNPMSIQIATNDRLDGSELRAFLAAKARLDRQIASLTPQTVLTRR
ncbi:MAG: peptidoglycan DD-metalloendopeptidase family protein [Rhodospirillales bacterium]